MSNLNQIRKEVISKKIMIKPKYMNDYNYIKNIIMSLENTCIEVGYIEKIHSVDKIIFDKFYEQSFCGSLLLIVNFTANIVSIKNEQEIECRVMKSNEDGIVAEGAYPIFVIIDDDYENISFLNIDDIIKVKILKWNISREKNLIRAVGRYIGKSKDKEIEINEDIEYE